MKTLIIGLAFLFLGLLAPSCAQTNQNSGCNIQLYKADRENYNQLTQGFIISLYRKNPSKCDICEKLGLAAGTLQNNFVTLENNRNKWIDIQAVYKMSYLNQVNQLIQIIQLFGSTAVSLDAIMREGKIVGMIELIKNRMVPSYQTQMQSNLLESLQTLIILWQLAPGASCHAIGARMGITLKKLLKIDFEMIDEAKFQSQPILNQQSPKNLLN